MSNVENLDRQVKELSPEELAALSQVEQDVAAGKLDTLADKALRDHAAGKSTRPGTIQ